MELTPSEIEVMKHIQHIENTKRNARIKPVQAIYEIELRPRFPHYENEELQAILNSLVSKGIIEWGRTANHTYFKSK